MIYQTIVFLPMLGALIAGFLGPFIGPRPSEVITTLLVCIGGVLSWIVFFRVGFGGEVVEVPISRWVTSGDLDISWALKIDTLTAVMLVVVNTGSGLVHPFSIGYMHEGDAPGRF